MDGGSDVETYEGKQKSKNGIKRLIFSVLSILLQVVFLILIFTRLNEYASIIDWTTRVLAILLVLFIYSQNQTATMKVPWIILILAFPILGVALYFLVGLNGGTKKMKWSGNVRTPSLGQGTSSMSSRFAAFGKSPFSLSSAVHSTRFSISRCFLSSSLSSSRPRQWAITCMGS